MYMDSEQQTLLHVTSSSIHIFYDTWEDEELQQLLIHYLKNLFPLV